MELARASDAGLLRPLRATVNSAERYFARLGDLTNVLDTWCEEDVGERSYEQLRTPTGWLVRLRSDRNGLLTEQTEKPTKADALASAAMIVTHNPYLE